MLRFEYFYDNWLDVSNYVHDIPDQSVTLNPDFFKSLRFDDVSLTQYRIDAVKRLTPMLGDKPALCFSGGIDSQATWQCFNEAGYDIDVYTLVFKDDLNKQDVDHAILFAKKHNINLQFVEIDIINFLSRENSEYSKIYKSLSPHFNTHYRLCDILRSRGYTSFVCGGGSPLLTDDMSQWVSNYSQNFLNYINYSEISGVFCQGNFLGFDPYLAWALSIFTPVFSNEVYSHSNNLYKDDRDRLEFQRYHEKVQGYKNIGFDIIPQTKKYTGFELVKDKLEVMYGDGWAFEKMFRFPLRTHVKEMVVKINIKDDTIDIIRRLNREKSTSCLDTSTGI